ncbi:phage-related baseplate assembly protein [Tibeticola sediminis]|uniref:Phage-related baseplate assembly protein n=1 Tax=Tibeticola sediminis TaxID=1917811 RepID=A0A3N4UPG2_9BURK|nr:baseplate J/gp47 family protein [Tibeticola sediminis]RPE72536.1 phage-related baseplate assembly protein [Tibeticola sediminis]
MSSAADLSTLPPPAVVEPLGFDAVLASIKADLTARLPEIAPVLALESEPLVKLLEVAAWRETVLRARVNDASRAVMLPWATGADLDNLAARYDIVRLPGEDDDRLRRRVLIGYHALSAAGSAASWRLRALSVSTDIRQVDVWADRPGRVKVCLLARVSDDARDVTAQDAAVGRSLFGAHPDASRCWRAARAGDPIVAQVAAALLAEDVRPLSVDVDVTVAQALPVAVSARLIHPPGMDAAQLVAQARQRLETLAGRSAYRVDLTRAAMVAALMGDGIRDVIMTSPAEDVAAGPGELPVITAIDLTTEARHD